MLLHRLSDPAVKAVFEAYPQDIRAPLEDLRETILDVGRALNGIGPLEESLKWGQPAYRPLRPRTGTTVRIGPATDADGQPGYALYVPCQTTLIRDIRRLYRDRLRYAGDRAVVFAAGETPPPAPLKHFIALALTYHSRERAMA